MKFLREWLFYFKRLWKNPWWYFLIGVSLIGGNSWMRWAIATSILALLSPCVAALYSFIYTARNPK